MAGSMSPFRNRERSALPQFALRDQSFAAALRLSLPELQREIFACPPASPHDRVLSLLPKA
jgi:hypothetical protein